MSRGGRRQGRVGDKFGNRSDLQLGARLPAMAPGGQVYGARKAQLDAQRALPLQRPAVPSPGTPPAGPGPAQAASPPPALDSPTSAPAEPLTTGIAAGPGAGPEAITPPTPLLHAATLLNSLGAGANADVARMRDVLNAALANENLR